MTIESHEPLSVTLLIERIVAPEGKASIVNEMNSSVYGLDEVNIETHASYWAALRPHVQSDSGRFKLEVWPWYCINVHVSERQSRYGIDAVRRHPTIIADRHR